MQIKKFISLCLVHDASAKIPSGILSGNIHQLGDFDECLNAKAPNNEFSGKYCLAYVQISVPAHLPKLSRLRKLLQAHDAFVNDFDDVSTANTLACNLIMVKFNMLIFLYTTLFSLGKKKQLIQTKTFENI